MRTLTTISLTIDALLAALPLVASTTGGLRQGRQGHHDRGHPQGRRAVLRRLQHGRREPPPRLDGVQYQWVVPAEHAGLDAGQDYRRPDQQEGRRHRHLGQRAEVRRAVIKKAMDSGIKVLTFDSDSPKSGRSMYIGTVNAAAGETMGESMAKAIDGKGEVAIVTGQLGAVTTSTNASPASRRRWRNTPTSRSSRPKAPRTISPRRCRSTRRCSAAIPT